MLVRKQSLYCIAPVLVGVFLTACGSNDYYDNRVSGTGIFVGADSYRLLEPPDKYQPYQPAVRSSAASGRAEIRIFAPNSYRGDLGKLAAACAKRVGVIGPVQINKGRVRSEKFASLMPTANVSAFQQERTAKCVETSIK